MNIFNKSFEQINTNDIKNLITQETTEGQNLEFKREVWRRNDEEIKEMLRDISSMTNKYGGYFIIGMDEEPESGKALQLINIENAENERDRIFASCLANINPRIPGLNIKCLSSNNGNIILIYVPGSLMAPHLITFKGLNQFWIRHDRQKSKMTVEEIRDAFLKNFRLTKNVEKFLKERREQLVIDLSEKRCYILSAFPLGIYNEFVDIKDADLREKLKTPPNERHGGWNLKFTNNTVYPSYYGLKISGSNCIRELELHRNGYLEAKIIIDHDHFQIDSALCENKKIAIISGYPIIEYLYSFLKQVRQIKDHLSCHGQYLVCVFLLNIKNHGLRQYKPNTFGYNDNLKPANVWQRNNLEIGPLSFEHIDPKKITKLIGDRIWQSFGYEKEPFFENDKLNLQ